MSQGVWVLCCAFAAALSFVAPSAGASRPLVTAVSDPYLVGDSPADGVFARIRQTGATVVRIVVVWRDVAPGGEARPEGFDPRDPFDPSYSWTSLDRRLRKAVAHGLEPLVSIQAAPDWAEGQGQGPPGTIRPSEQELGSFAEAAARRYSGRYAGLPRVRYWMAWNEPNLDTFLNPQFENGIPVSFVYYRRMLNAFATAVHKVDPSNVVVGGGLAPFGLAPSSQGPLEFMRGLLCIGTDLRPTCQTKVLLDVWSHHPYTSGGPTHKAYHADDVSLGDLPKMRAVLNAAQRFGMIRSHGPVGFWVTEFSWDTKPPDPGGVPLALHARWVSEALYRMWKNGITLVTWFKLSDQPLSAGPFQCGLYFANGRAKPALQAFRFPFVALREGGAGVLVWGRSPTSTPDNIAVERRAGRGWIRLTTLHANRYGIFQKRLALTGTTGHLRARVLGPKGQASLPFDLVRPPDMVVKPFGNQ